MSRSFFVVAAAVALSSITAAAATGGAAPPAAKKPASKAAARKAAPPAVPPAPPLAPASDEQKAAALLAHLGDYGCEFEQTLKVSDHAPVAGYIDVAHKGQTWVMKPIVSSTGALRLEDVRGRMLMIQIANKSMVMDTQLGQRVVDGCQHDKQREFERTLNAQPPADTLLK